MGQEVCQLALGAVEEVPGHTIATGIALAGHTLAIGDG